MVRELTRTSAPLVERPLPEDDPKIRKPDITRARTMLGWEPKVGIREGLQKTIDYFASLPAERMQAAWLRRSSSRARRGSSDHTSSRRCSRAATSWWAIDNFDSFYDPDLKRANLAEAMLHPLVRARRGGRARCRGDARA